VFMKHFRLCKALLALARFLENFIVYVSFIKYTKFWALLKMSFHFI